MTLLDQVLLVLVDGGTAPSAVGDSWDCCAGLERPHQGAAAAAAAAGAFGGCSGEACLGKSEAVVVHCPLPQLQLVVVVAHVLVHLVLAGEEVLLVLQCFHLALRLVLDAHPLHSAAAASAFDVETFAEALHFAEALVTWSWDTLAVGLAAQAHPVVHLAAAGDHLLLRHQAEVGMMGISQVVPGQAA